MQRSLPDASAAIKKTIRNKARQKKKASLFAKVPLAVSAAKKQLKNSEKAVAKWKKSS